MEKNACFCGQIAVVTGASSGIGRAIALDLAGHGAEVVLVARRRELLESVAENAVSRGARAHVCCADLTQDRDLHDLADMVKGRLGRTNILVLCGGAISHNTTELSDLEHLDLQYRANVRGHYALTQMLLPLLREQRGQIVFMNSSVATRAAVAGTGQFVSTQYAIHAIADSLRAEVNAAGVRVLSVFAGRTATPRTAELFKSENRVYRPELLLQPEDVAQVVTHTLTLPRTAEVTDISIRPMCRF